MSASAGSSKNTNSGTNTASGSVAPSALARVDLPTPAAGPETSTTRVVTAGESSVTAVEVITDLAACPSPEGGTVVTIGVYDGVHLGHRALIGRVRAMAAELGAATAVVTFDRHPAVVVRPDSAPKLLTDLPQRLELLASTGADFTVVIEFDEARSHETAEDFVRDVLVEFLHARAVVVGHDFHFGHNRGGNVPMLQRMGADLGFDVLGIMLVADDDGANEVVSST